MDPLTLLVFVPLIVGFGAKAIKALRKKGEAVADAELRRQRAAFLKLPAVVQRKISLCSRDGLDYLNVARSIEASSLSRGDKDTVLASITRRMVGDQDLYAKLAGLEGV